MKIENANISASIDKANNVARGRAQFCILLIS